LTKLIMNMSGEQFNEIIKGLAAVTTETRIYATPEGIDIRCVDTANVAMIEMKLSKGYFIVYHCDFEGLITPELEFAIDVNRFASSIKPKKTDGIQWIVKGEYSEINVNGSRKFRIKNLDLNTCRKRPNPYKRKWNNRLEIEAKVFYDFVMIAKIMADRMTCEFCDVGEDSERLRFVAEGDTDERSEYLGYNIIEIEGTSGFVSHYSLDYLKDITRYLKDKRKIEIECNTDYPIRITKRNLGQDVDSYVRYLLAPRIEAD
jgi:proliferating cell nuclear antigen